MKFLIFSDLDGTFLNSETYSFGALKNYIKKFNFQYELIFVSSKTYDEIINIQKKLNINFPFIVENGACIFFPLDYFKNKKISSKLDNYKNHLELRLTAFDAVKFYKQISFLKEKYNFSFYMDLPNKKITELTNLKNDSVKLSKLRKFSNPILWEDSFQKKLNFIEEVKSLYNYYSISEGGRFLHISDRFDKGLAINKLLDFKKEYDLPFITISLGDSENDIPMFKLTDFACIIKSKSKLELDNVNKNIYISNMKAPDGWKESLDFILKKEIKNF